MSSLTIQPVVLCGGNGTRLWPVSTPDHPKQLITLGSKTLLQRTLDRIEMIRDKTTYLFQDPILVSTQDHPGYRTIKEPFTNDTAVALLRLALEVKDNVYFLIFPADHYIFHEEAFVHDIIQGLSKVTLDNIVLYGLSPTSPESKYGYIIPSPERIAFKEKPDKETAQQYIATGALWNSGIVLIHRKVLYESLHHLCSWILHPHPGKGPSFDVTVLQEYPNLTLQTCQGWAWSDVGTWESFIVLPEIMDEIKDNESTVTEKCENVTVLNRSHGKVIVIGCDDLLVIRNEHDTLIVNCKMDYNSLLKSLSQ